MNVREDLTARLRVSTVWSVGAGLFAMSGQLLAIPLSISTVSVMQYGGLLICLAAAQFLSVLDFGFGAATTREIAAGLKSGAANDVMRASRRVFVAVAVSSAAMSAVVTQFLLQQPALDDLTPAEEVLLSMGFPAVVGLATFGRHLQCILYGYLRYDIDKTNQFAAVFLKISGLSVVAIQDWGVIGVIVCEFVGLVFPAIAAMIRIGSVVPQYYRLPQQEREGASQALRRLMGYGIAWFSVGLPVQASIFLPPTIVGLYGSGVAVVAVAAAFRLIQAARQVLNWLLDPLLPGLASADLETRILIIRTADRLLGFLSALVIMPAIVLMKPFMILWLGDERLGTQSWWVFAGLGVGLLLSNGYQTLSAVSLADGRPGFFAAPAVLSSALILSACGIAARLDGPWIFLLFTVCGVLGVVAYELRAGSLKVANRSESWWRRSRCLFKLGVPVSLVVSIPLVVSNILRLATVTQLAIGGLLYVGCVLGVVVCMRRGR